MAANALRSIARYESNNRRPDYRNVYGEPAEMAIGRRISSDRKSSEVKNIGEQLQSTAAKPARKQPQNRSDRNGERCNLQNPGFDCKIA